MGFLRGLRPCYLHICVQTQLLLHLLPGIPYSHIWLQCWFRRIRVLQVQQGYPWRLAPGVEWPANLLYASTYHVKSGAILSVWEIANNYDYNFILWLIISNAKQWNKTWQLMLDLKNYRYLMKNLVLPSTKFYKRCRSRRPCTIFKKIYIWTNSIFFVLKFRRKGLSFVSLMILKMYWQFCIMIRASWKNNCGDGQNVDVIKLVSWFHKNMVKDNKIWTQSSVFFWF